MEGPPLWMRIYFAAVGWGNQLGHAEFSEGELAKVLGQSGNKYASQNVYRAVQTAVRYGLVQDGSGVRCLILPGHHFQQGMGATVCRWHGAKLWP